MEEAIRHFILNSSYHHLYRIIPDRVMEELDTNACEGNTFAALCQICFGEKQEFMDREDWQQGMGPKTKHLRGPTFRHVVAGNS